MLSVFAEESLLRWLFVTVEFELSKSVLFYQVQNFITHFWQGMPGHITSVLECPVVVDIVAICDSILYKVNSRVCSVHDIEERSADLHDSLFLLSCSKR